MILAENILAYCEINGISRQEFEIRCGLSNGLVYKWERGIAKNPTYSTLTKIERATRIPVSRWMKKGGIYAKRKT